MYKAFQLYSAQEAEEVLEHATSLEFEDGRLTAGKLAAPKKKNFQAVAGETLRQLRERLVRDLIRHPGVSSFALSRRFSAPIVNRTLVDGEYGAHVDAARMVGLDGLPLRTDVSYTLFLSAPDTYDGGALCFQLASHTIRVKLEPGQIVLYPSTLTHSVETVTRGERYCIVGWIESLVANLEARSLLHRLDVLSHAISEQFEDLPEELGEESVALYQGLLRVLAS